MSGKEVLTGHYDSLRDRASWQAWGEWDDDPGAHIVRGPSDEAETEASWDKVEAILSALPELERAVLQEYLTDRNQSAAARRMGLPRTTFQYRLAEAQRLGKQAAHLFYDFDAPPELYEEELQAVEPTQGPPGADEVRAVYQATGSQRKTAELLGMSRTSVQRALKAAEAA